MTRLVALAAAALFVDALFIVALGPLLPDLKESMRLTGSQAGLLAGGFAAGEALVAWPAAAACARFGVQPTMTAGLVVLTVASTTFALADSYEALLGAQLGAGAAGGTIWLSAMTWLITATPPAQRGEAIGVGLSAFAAGQIMGPAVGGVASAAGRAPTFGAIAVLIATLAAVASVVAGPKARREPLGLRTAVRSNGVRLTASLHMVVGAVLGALLVLSTLHLHDVGWREGVIAAVFVIAGATGVVLQPFIGRWSDRQGRLRPLRLSLAATIVLTLALAGLHGRWIVALLVTLALISVRGLIGPSLALLSDACDRTGLGQASALALSTVIGPAAFAVGAAGAGAIQDAASAAWGFAALAALLAVVRVAMSMRDHRRLRAQATGVT